ncbi:MAG: hypothetical protein IJH50_06105 [Kiritimatiellae bacterium]|nr:hypothetical protein [Kiritimatiellia bacterium]
MSRRSRIVWRVHLERAVRLAVLLDVRVDASLLRVVPYRPVGVAHQAAVGSVGGGRGPEAAANGKRNKRREDVHLHFADSFGAT